MHSPEELDRIAQVIKESVFTKLLPWREVAKAAVKEMMAITAEKYNEEAERIITKFENTSWISHDEAHPKNNVIGCPGCEGAHPYINPKRLR